MKIAICFGLIIGAIISICNMCFAANQVEYLTADNLAIRPSTSSIVEYSGATLYYIELEPGYQYTITNISNSLNAFGFFDSLEVGSSVSVHELPKGSSYSFNGSSAFLYVGNSSGPVSNFSITREELQGMTSFVDNLAYDLSYANLSGVLFFVVPIMSIAILVGLGFYLLKRLLNRIKRAKGGV